MNPVQSLPAGEILVIDGGTGTELRARGVPMDPICWLGRAALTHYETLVQVHVDFINAGARVVTANTFATHRYVLSAAGYDSEVARATGASIAAAKAARDATDPTITVAGSMSCMPPGIFGADYPDEAAVRASYAEHAQALAENGVDLIALEMIQDTVHGRWAYEAAAETGLPIWLGFSCKSDLKSNHLVSFDIPEVRFESLLAEFVQRSPELITIMHTPAEDIAAAIEVTREYWNGPIGVYPEVGVYMHEQMRRTGEMTPEEFTIAAKAWIGKGAVVVGGCCGSTPAHIRTLAARLRESPAD